VFVAGIFGIVLRKNRKPPVLLRKDAGICYEGRIRILGEKLLYHAKDLLALTSHQRRRFM
jgi:hypothetical protein